jgi:predicted metal-dependent HD superfamily phosphohydrolase
MWSVSDEERDALEAAWMAFLIPRGAGVDRIAAWWRELESRYSEPHRQYHTLAHVSDMLQMVHGEAATAAAWFHDIVYDPTRPDNEDASARIAATALRELGFGAPAIDVIARMIRATADYERNALPLPALVVVDADLAILGSSEERYAAYRYALRCEFASMPDEEFNESRRRLAERLLARPTIYFTQTMRERYEQQARSNLSLEL